MMLKKAVLFLSLCLFFRAAYAQPISSAELINNAKGLDDKAVAYQGEVIGELMKRADFAWVNVSDGTNAVGVWVPLVLAREIIYAGGYQAKGDVVEITGIFHRACPEHGGDLDIHAQSLRKITSGRITRDRLNPAKVNQALILLGALLGIWILTLFLRK